MGRNWDWSHRQGKSKRLEAEYRAFYYHTPVPSQPPLYNHDTTMQSQFEQGWNRVTHSEIYRHTNQSPPMPKQASGSQQIATLKNRLRNSSCRSH